MMYIATKTTTTKNLNRLTILLKQKYSHHLYTLSQRQFRTALILAGCGQREGTDIQEAMSCMIALSKYQSQFDIYTLNKSIVADNTSINHKSSQKSKQQATNSQQHHDQSKQMERNVKQESDRLINSHSVDHSKDITDLLSKVDDYDALVIPGGHGVLTNLSTATIDKQEQQQQDNKLGQSQQVDGGLRVDQNVQDVVRAFHSKRKHIACTSQAILLASKILDTNLELALPSARDQVDTQDNNPTQSKELDNLNASTNIIKPAPSDNDKTASQSNSNHYYHFDPSNNLLSTPVAANLLSQPNNQSPSDLHESIDKMIRQISLAHLSQDELKRREQVETNRQKQFAKAEEIRQKKEERLREKTAQRQVRMVEVEKQREEKRQKDKEEKKIRIQEEKKKYQEEKEKQQQQGKGQQTKQRDYPRKSNYNSRSNNDLKQTAYRRQ